MKIKAAFFLLTLIYLRANAEITIISVQDFTYTPGTVTVSLGDTVRFQWISGNHPTASDDGSFADIAMDVLHTQFDLVLITAGTYPFHCLFHGTSGGEGMAGTIIVESPPACETPTGISAPNISASSAKISWSPVTGALQYQLQYRPTGTTAWIKKSTASSFKKINMLSASTTYQYRVKTVCDGMVSGFSTIQTFTTLPLRGSGVNDTDVSGGLKVYPNPASTFLNIAYTDLKPGFGTLDILDFSGRILYSEKIEIHCGHLERRIELPGHYNGITCIRITTSSEQLSELVMVN
ncbi:MAG: fibronectin type III domain-containing protein [Chitinophagales bacterium]|nr:fibronectin type III domain-containing protein [Chitinophagales bacterium]